LNLFSKSKIQTDVEAVEGDHVPDLIAGQGLAADHVPDLVTAVASHAQGHVPDLVTGQGLAADHVPDLIAEASHAQSHVPDLNAEANHAQSHVQDLAAVAAAGEARKVTQKYALISATRGTAKDMALKPNNSVFLLTLPAADRDPQCIAISLTLILAAAITVGGTETADTTVDATADTHAPPTPVTVPHPDHVWVEIRLREVRMIRDSRITTLNHCSLA